MDLQCYGKLPQKWKAAWMEFLAKEELTGGDDAEYTVMLTEDGEIQATGSRAGNILKYFAVAPECRGEGLTAKVLTELQKDAFLQGMSHLFLYTKPKNRSTFEGLRFSPVAETADVLLMENRARGVEEFLKRFPRAVEPGTGEIGAIVMNADPFTLGHRYLVETAAGRCKHLYVFVLSENRGRVPAADRLELVRRGTADLDNVTVYETGDYLISSATFPDYFLKKSTDGTAAQCELDCRVFAEHFAKHFGITRRFAGSEPESAVTESYNRQMERCLPELGIGFTEIPRLMAADGRPVSAGRVRNAWEQGRGEDYVNLVPETTYTYLKTGRL